MRDWFYLITPLLLLGFLNSPLGLFIFNIVGNMVRSEGLSAAPSPPQAATKQYGVTKPISTAGPVDADIQRTLELEKV